VLERQVHGEHQKRAKPVTLEVWTARVSYGGIDRLDITRNTAPHHGRPFSPSSATLWPALDARDRAKALRLVGQHGEADELEARAWEIYRPAFLEEMRDSYRHRRWAWDRLLAEPRVTLVCYCVDAKRCHRRLVAEILARLGATDHGERPRELQRGRRRAQV
jgi:hypothetical protein